MLLLLWKAFPAKNHCLFHAMKAHCAWNVVSTLGPCAVRVGLSSLKLSGFTSSKNRTEALRQTGLGTKPYISHAVDI
jgi:hypothetical protein